MAAYTELFNLRTLTPTNAAFREKVAVAVTKKAQLLVDQAAPTANELLWAQHAFEDPLAVANILLNYVLVANSTATVAQILAATDAAIQANVDAAVTKLIAGGLV
jgi:hypothetical protein